MIVSIWGKEGDGKSSIGLSWPKPLFHLDLDLGGFDRAIWRVEEEAAKEGNRLRIKRCAADEDIVGLNWDEWDIVSKPYLAPIQLGKLLGIQQQQGVSVRFPREVIGIKELWQKIIIDVVNVCRVSVVKSVMPDSATQLWWICHTGFLQEKQEVQIGGGVKTTDNTFREKLLPVEFPNNRMRDLIYSVRSFGKNLVMTHYPKDIYKEKVTDKGIESYRSGEVEPDGFKHTVTLDDLVIWSYSEIDRKKEITDMTPGPTFGKPIPNPDFGKPVPHATISLKCGLSGMGMKAVGLELPTPNYAGLMALQSMMRGE